jgi:Beta-propeller repeat
VAKLNATGSALVYATYLGGSGDGDAGLSIAVDTAGAAYVTGFTSSTDFPVVHPLQPTPSGAFVAKVATLAFAGTPGTANCQGQSVSALAREFGGLEAAAAALGFPSVQALQDAIREFCEV